jgi:hypothetical protein
LWIVLGLIVLGVGGCICVAGAALLFFWPLSPLRTTTPAPTVVVSPLHTATPSPTAQPTATAPIERQPATPTAVTLPSPTPTVLSATPTRALPPTAPPPTATAAPDSAHVEPFIPDLSGFTSAAFTFSRTDGMNDTHGMGQLIWPEQSVYEIDDSLYMAEGGELLYWNDDLDDWVEALPSARLHDNLVYWLRLLTFATPDSAALQEDGTIFCFFSLEVPREENIFGVRDLEGMGWFTWDPEQGVLRELAYDLFYEDRLGTSINEVRYMEFESWGEPVVIPERQGE